MRGKHTAASLALAFAGVVLTAGACNSGLGDCPAPSTITNGTSCNDDNLDCPWEIAAPPSCAGIMTSCVCTGGAWACPTPTDCASEGGTEGGAPEGGAVEAGPGDGSTGDGASESSTKEASRG